MGKLTTKKIAGIAILTALYCIASALMKIPFIGAISLDLGYIVLAIGCIMYGPWGAFIGAVGCGIESILFSPYGFSIGWFVGNLIIGLGCGIVFKRTKNLGLRIITVIGFIALGILVAKTIIECNLYGIPLLVKLPKSAVAFAVDSVVMILGVLLAKRIKKIEKIED